MKQVPVPVLPANLDLFSKYGAGVLAEHIESYWAARGHKGVKAERYDVLGGGTTWGVRSNLVNGLPMRAKINSSLPRALGVFKL